MEKINIAKLLENCPKGMELDCTIYDNVEFEGISDNKDWPIKISVEGYPEVLNPYGCISYRDYAKCVIFPKGKTTWDGFVPPYKFKDGDILFVEAIYNWIVIYKENENKEDLYKYIAILHYSNDTYIAFDNTPLCCRKDVTKIRFATEEEKKKLFKMVKDRGYKWNSKTKTLEKLVNMEDKEINNFNVLPGLYKCVHRMFDGTPDGKLLFEVGNIYKCLSKHDRAEFEVSYGHSIYLEDPVVCKHFIPFETQGEQKSNPCEKCNHPMLNCHNFPCIKKKTFDQGKSALEAIREERVDNANKIEPKFKVGDRIVEKNGITKPFTISQVGGGYYYVNEKNAVGIMRIEDQDKYELVPDKFDISTLKPFDSRVLVRDYNNDKWKVSFWGCLIDSESEYKYDTVRGCYRQCIPYERNEYLLGKKDNCKDFYKIWE